MTQPATIVEIREVAVALAGMREHLVFTGGAIVTLLITDPGAGSIRTTTDVDVYLHHSTMRRHQAAEAELRAHGFEQPPGGPICRWHRGALSVDLMADDANVLGFTNRWYRTAADHTVLVDLAGVMIRMIGAPWFIATKLEAFDAPDRENGGDLQASHDLEDIVAVFDGRATLGDEIDRSPGELRGYLQARLGMLIADRDFYAALVGHVGGDGGRARIVLGRITAAVRLQSLTIP